MTQIDLEWAHRTRRMKEELDMYVEVQTFLPREDSAVFEHAVDVAKEAGATSLRVVCLLGRRYEMFDTLEGWKTAVAGFHKQIAAALPIVEKYKMPLGIENHKDWRVDEQVALLRQYDSEYLGVSLDTGNNLTVLDDPRRWSRSWRPTPSTSTSRTWRPRSASEGISCRRSRSARACSTSSGWSTPFGRAKPDVFSRSR